MNLGFSRKRATLYAALVPVVTGARGLLLAQSIGGRYHWLDWLSDSAAFALLILTVILLDAGLRGILAKACSRSPQNRTYIAATRLLFLTVGLFPFLLATIQIHPQRIRTKGTPRDWNLPYENVVLQSDERLLQGWYCPQDDPISAVFVAHGLNANRENFMAPVRLLHDLGHAVLIIDFPAHGDSQGRSTTLGMREAEDVRVAHEWLSHRHQDLPIDALGYSMGASAVLRAAATFKIFRRIAIDGTFTSVRQVADATVLRFTGPLRTPIWHLGRFWIRLWTGADLNRHRPIDNVAEIPGEKLLIIHGTTDRVIPFDEGLALHEATGGRARFLRVEGYGHAETISHPDYAVWLDDFFQR